jgi:hypothetical protein
MTAPMMGDFDQREEAGREADWASR